MKKILFVSVTFLILNFNASAQNWFTDFKKATHVATEMNHNIVLVFQGSDWCAPCIKLDREIWSNSEFQNLAKDHFIMLKADFPRKKSNRLSEELQKQNAKLAEKYNNQGFFPLVVVLDKSGNVLGKMGYEKTTPLEYFKELTSFEK